MNEVGSKLLRYFGNVSDVRYLRNLLQRSWRWGTIQDNRSFIYLVLSNCLQDSKRSFRITVLSLVAEGISYFCLARNLIRPLGLTHNFTQSGWLILFYRTTFLGSTNWGTVKHSLWLNNFVQCRRLTVCSSMAAAASTQWGKLSNSWTPCAYFS